ncbi:MAG: hypothetical protein NT004_00035, partial [Bacteroidetes bacterium]|nr:hypothetical protein [Bacteroidota bacterium]
MKKFYFAFLLLFPMVSFSQHEFDNWCIGWHAAMTFKNGFPENLPPSAMVAQEEVCVSVSDSNGQLLFYSNGYRVYNREHSVMPNGYNLSGVCGDQYISVQNLVEKNKHFLFTVSCFPHYGYPLVGLRYSVIDMNLDGGNGDIISGQKDLPMPFGDSAWTQLSATRHQNNKYAWVVTLSHGHRHKYLSYLIDSTGINAVPVVSQSTLVYSDINSGNNFLKISPDGSYLVCGDSLMEVCRFDKLTGIITPMFKCNPGSLPLNPETSGKEFSTDSRFLYVIAPDTSSGSGEGLFQFDMTNTDSASFMQSQIKVGDSLHTSIQMAPDGKIYTTRSGYGSTVLLRTLGVINNPSGQGIACDYQSTAFVLDNDHANVLPQFLQRYKAYLHHTEGCMADSVRFSADIWPPADSIHWDFGDPASGTSNYSNLTTPAHLYATPGNHTVEMWVRHNDKRTDTTWVTLSVTAPPSPQLGINRTICTGNSVTFDAGVCTNCSFLWTDLLTATTVGAAQTITTGVAGIYEAAVTDANGCAGRDTVELSITPVPVLMNDTLSKSICTGKPTDIPLASNISTAMFHWTATLTLGAVTGFSADSGLVISQTLVNGGATAGVVTYHITPKVGDCFGTTVDFPVTINVGDPVDVSILASVNNICAGASVTFTVSPANPGVNPTYQWKVNALDAGFNSPVFTYLPANGDIVHCLLTSSNTICTYNNPATSNSITMVVNPLQLVSVSISPSANPVCSGTSVTFTAFATNGGTIPGYQWKVNGTNEGTNNPVFSFSPVNGDVVTCSLSSSETCASGNPAPSNPITMLVNANLPAGITIAASAN